MSRSNQDQDRQSVLSAFAKQIAWCESLGSPFTARLLTVLADDIAAGGISAALVRAWPGDPVADALALRMAGALHALALRATSPALAACYPPHAATLEQLRSVLPRVMEEHRNAIHTFMSSAPQTNEVGRSGVLVGGFLQIAKETGLPLRLLEIGASAGLNAVWDRYHYQFGAADWGDRQSAVRIAPRWEGPLPPLDARVRVIERLACDMAPVDLEDPAQRLRLRAYVWADQIERLSRLESAISLARAHGPRVRPGRRRRLGQSKAAGASRSERNRRLPFHHVAVSAGADSGRHHREPSARRRSGDGRGALGLVALRALASGISAGAAFDFVARRPGSPLGRRSPSWKQRTMVRHVNQPSVERRRSGGNALPHA